MKITRNRKTYTRKKKIGISILILILFGLSYILYVQNKPSSFTYEDYLNLDQGSMTNISQDDEHLKQLLEEFKPQIYVHEDSYYPLDFYEDYVSNASLYSSELMVKRLKDSISSEDLQEYASSSDYFVDYEVDHMSLLDLKSDSVSAPIYGRGYRSTLSNDSGELDLIFLKYTLAFPYSGLPADTSKLKLFGSNIIGDSLNWHELDIHGAIHIVLKADNYEPVGIILAQHNHHFVQLVNEEFIWPENNRVKIAIAKYSNEPYLVLNENDSRSERVVGNPMNYEFLFGLTDKVPLTGGYDYIPNIAKESILVEVNVKQLPLDDPLYKAGMKLGDEKRVLGLYKTYFMDGPPGADLYTMPATIDLVDLMAFWNVDLDDQEYLDLLSTSKLSFMDMEVDDLLSYQREKLFITLTQ